jgi:hypothetical protein
MEDRNTAQLATGPFRLVFVEVWMDGLEEWSDEWYLP